MEPCLGRAADAAGVALDKPAVAASATVLWRDSSAEATTAAPGAGRVRKDRPVRRRRRRWHIGPEFPERHQRTSGAAGDLADRLRACGLTVELVMQPDQISNHRLQHHPAEPTAELLVVFMQPVNDRFAVRRTPVKLAELLFHALKPAGQLGYHRASITPSRFFGIVGPIDRVSLAGPNRQQTVLKRNLSRSRHAHLNTTEIPQSIPHELRRHQALSTMKIRFRPNGVRLSAGLITLADKGYISAGQHVLVPYRGRAKPARKRPPTAPRPATRSRRACERPAQDLAHPAQAPLLSLGVPDTSPRPSTSSRPAKSEDEKGSRIVIHTRGDVTKRVTCPKIRGAANVFCFKPLDR